MQLDDAVYNLVMSVPKYRKRLLFVAIGGLMSLYLRNKRLVDGRITGKDSGEQPLLKESSRKTSKSPRVGVNAMFFAQLKKILPICIPGVIMHDDSSLIVVGIWSREFAMLVSLAGILIARTYLDIWFTGFNGVVVRAIVTKDWNLFVKNALSFTNNSLKLIINKLSLAVRTRLTHHAHHEYLKGLTFYKVSNIDNRIQNIDQLLTQDIEKFSDNLVHLYSDIAKPIVDIGLFAYKLGESIGAEAPIWMLGYFFLGGGFLRAISPPFGKYVAIEQALEGDFRYSHSRVITHAEEIAFYGGEAREKGIVNESFERIAKHLNKVFLLRFGNGIIDSVVVKYCATMLAYVVLSRPVFGPKSKKAEYERDPTKIMEDYSRNSGYLINLSQAIGRIVLAGRDLTRFAGFTSRVADLFDVLEDVNNGRYQRAMISQEGNGINDIRIVDVNELKSQVEEQDGVISFQDVPVATPNGDILVENLSMVIESGMNCLITGPNGSGKSSLFRILGGLWPLFEGKMIKPTKGNMFYVPQRPYLPLGTLRDQLIYPDSQSDMARRGITDEGLLHLLEVVHLAYLVDREGGWGAVRDWADVLSGGEKQRVAMARLFYHKPQFAILDECTSAVSIDVEGEMYAYAKDSGITLFTVSHRPSLFAYHDFLLRFDGLGHYEFGPLDHDNPNPLKHPFNFSQGSKDLDQGTSGSAYRDPESSEDSDDQMTI